MALVIADRVKETTTTTGTGTVTLLGASTGFQSFAAIGNANTTYYTIAAQTGTEWEVGIGTFTSSGTTLARTTVLSNSSGTEPSALSFSAGTKDVFVTYPSDRAIYGDVTGSITPVDNALVRFDSTAGNIIQTSLVTLADDGAIVAPQAGSIIPFYWNDVASFPSASTYHGAIAHAHSTGAMYFAHGGVWTRILDDSTDVTVAQGGTGLSTLTANNVILGNGTSTPLFVAPSSSGNVLTSNGTTWASTAPATSGDVVGPASATDNALARFDLTTGKLIQNSVGILSDAGVLTGLTGITSSGPITLSSLTAGRVTYAGTAGLLVDSANLTFSGTILTSTGFAGPLDGTVGAITPAAGTFTSLSDSGNLTFTGTGNRITGDFSNATIANRVAFQTSTTNGNSTPLLLPNGTATTAGLLAFNNSDPTNAAFAAVISLSTAMQVSSGIAGTGTYVPMTFYTGGSERIRTDINGLTGFGTASATSMLQTAGSSSVSAFKTPNIAEVNTISATAATGTIQYDVTTQSVLYYTTNATGNFTVNFRGSSGTSLNTVMQTGESISATFLVTNGTTAYYNSAVTVDGSSVTPKYQGGTAYTSGNASSIDSYTYVIIKTGSAAFTVLASQTKFA